MTPSDFLLACLATAVFGSAASAQSFTLIPNGVECADVTADGEVVVGTGTNPGTGSSEAYYWRWRTDPAPSYIGGRAAYAISDDGAVIAGAFIDPMTGVEVAGRWTAGTGWVSLGGHGSACPMESRAFGMTPDGATIVGLVFQAGGCAANAFVWTQGSGLEDLGLVGSSPIGERASAISADGSLAVGFFRATLGRSPAYWTIANKLGVAPDATDAGEYYGVSADGSVRFGTLLNGANYRAFFEEDGVQTLLTPMDPAAYGAAVVGMSESGGTIVGSETVPGVGFPFGSTTTAWVWNPQGGMVGIRDRLTQLGVAGVPALTGVSALTPDGKVVVGRTQPGGQFTPLMAWIAEIPPGPITTPYGCGSNNPPGSLVHVSGSSSIGGQLTLGVDDPTGTMVGPALGIVAFSLDPDPNLPCGTPLPGFGMTGPTGDLLISLTGPNPFMRLTSPNLWTTPTQTVDVDFFTPPSTSLYGIAMYAQGVLFSTTTFELGLTNGLVITIGLD